MSQNSNDLKWWETTPLDQMTEEQWDSLCDGCGRCCLVKVWKDDTVKSCKVACTLLDIKTAKCKDYANRQSKVKNCIKVTLETIDTPGLLPDTCAYKLLKYNQPLYWWHHLISGSYDSVKEAGISVAGWVEVNEDQISMFKLAQYIELAVKD